MLNDINLLGNSLNKDSLNLDFINKQIMNISRYKYINEYEYLNGMLNPSENRNIKIPSKIPIPSVTFQHKYTFMMRTNKNGCGAIVLNPFFLASENLQGKVIQSNNENENIYSIASYLSTFYVSYVSNLDGQNDNVTFSPQNLGQTIPDIYSKYRLVSGYGQIKYNWALKEASGVCGCSIVNEKSNILGGRVYFQRPGDPGWTPDIPGAVTSLPETKKYGIFNNFINTYYHQENSLLEGVRALYYPLDNSYEEFVSFLKPDDIFFDYPSYTFQTKSKNYKTGFNWFFYIRNGPISQWSCLFETCLNYECLVNPDYLDYFPIETCYCLIPNNLKLNILEKIKNKSLTKINK